ncbi:MAG TPA: hypothetical protein DD640_07370 [Clostridiales bacterium]|nr:hypothetical protein [Clostridiales bacterium]
MNLKPALRKILDRSRSIRMQSLFYFLVGMCLTLIVSYVFSYFYMYSAVESLNEDSIQSDFAQIDLGLDYLYTNIDRQIKLTATADFTKVLLTHDKSIDVNLIVAVNEFRNSVFTMIRNFPYIHSIYLYLPDGRTYCITQSNARFLFDDKEPKPSDEIQQRVLSYSSYGIDYIGGLTTADYPLPYPPDSKQDSGQDGGQDIVSAVYRINEARLVMNIYSSQFESCYSGIASDENSRIYLLKADGEILSSLDKEQVGAQYSYYPLIQSADTGSIMIDDRQIISKTNPKQGYTIVFEVFSSVFINKFISQERNMLIIVGIGLLVTCFVFSLWMKKALSPLHYFVQSMDLAGQGHYDKKLPQEGNHEIAVLAANYNKMLDNLQILTRNKELAEQEKIESELAILRYQMNPHFLYNTLNNIRWMAIIAGNEDVSNSIKLLAEFIAPMFKENSSFYSLGEEIRSIELYTQIMNIRFGGGVRVQYDIPADTEQLFVPRFILQPFIENCFTHAFVKNANEGVILVRSRRTEPGLVVRIEDNGTGMEMAELDRLNDILAAGEVDKGIGLTNSNLRIRLYYGKSYGIRAAVADSGAGLAVTCLFPAIIKLDNPSSPEEENDR